MFGKKVKNSCKYALGKRVSRHFSCRLRAASPWHKGQCRLQHERQAQWTNLHWLNLKDLRTSVSLKMMQPTGWMCSP